VTADAQYLYVGSSNGSYAYRLNVDGTNTSLVTGFNNTVFAVLLLSENFVVFGGSMTASTLTTKIFRSLLSILEP
jgi:hypothetical protein